MLRSLTHHWRINLAVAAGAAVATAVLAGAVVIGDSMEASLRRLTLDRLGAVDWAVASDETFRDALVAELTDDARLEGATIAPVLAATASAVQVESRALASDVRLFGVDDRFAALFSDGGPELAEALERRSGQIFPSVVLNASLAREIGVEVGQDVLLSFEQITEIPRESLLGNKPAEGALAALRATVTGVIPDAGPGRFSLVSHQEQGLNAFVPLDVLQSRLDQPSRINTLLLGGVSDDLADDGMTEVLSEHLELDDLGLEIGERGAAVTISNRRFVLRSDTTDAIARVAGERGLETQEILGYLANQLVLGERSVPYSMVVGLDLPTPSGLGLLHDEQGAVMSEVPDDTVVLGSWAAAELDASIGDEIEVVYYEVGLNDELVTRSTVLPVSGIASMDGLATDRYLLPDFPGIADADDIAAWEPPFPMDLGSIRPQDEAFWDDYGPAPKAFVNLATAQRLWGNRFGDVTTVRLPSTTDTEALGSELLGALDLEAFRLEPQPVRARGLAASAGATDFAGLFLAFSFFLIIAAGLVVGLLFALSVEMRAREFGLLRAVGFPLRTVRRQLLAEGLLLGVIGCLVGVGLAIVYAAVLIRVIVNLWADTLDLPLLTLYLDPGHIVGAALGAVALVALAVVLTVRRLRRMPIPALLAGATRVETRRRAGRISRWVAIVAALAGLASIVGAQIAGAGSSAALFFVAGALFLTSGLAAFAAWLRTDRGRADAGSGAAYAWMAARNSAFNPGRSLLSVALVACASFMLVSVAANRRELRPESLGPDSGTGGFSLVASSAVPLRGSLEDPDTLAELGLSEPTIEGLATSGAIAMRLRPGDDASCLNLYQPETPRVVGVPESFIERGGFAFSSTLEATDNPWTLLERDYGEGVIPAIGDANSVTWILHSGLGQEIEMVDDRGETVRLLLVGLLSKSIFQSELVVSEAAFLEHFPNHGGFSYFLLERDDGDLAASLEAELAPYGFDATSTVEQLARFLGIEEMYLSTFQLLGGLGLILGTVGLGIVLVRNVNERRSELAMLRAVGFRRSSIGRLILLETGFQLACGLLIGSLAGFLALAPYFLDTSLHLPWSSLAATMGTVIVVGMLSAILGVSTALRTPLLPALKAD